MADLNLKCLQVRYWNFDSVTAISQPFAIFFRDGEDGLSYVLEKTCIYADDQLGQLNMRAADAKSEKFLCSRVEDVKFAVA